jgi:hypothetical protein
VQRNFRPEIPTDSNIPIELKDLIRDCWAIRPEDRPSAHDVFIRLQQIPVVDDQEDTDGAEKEKVEKEKVEKEKGKEIEQEKTEMRDSERLFQEALIWEKNGDNARALKVLFEAASRGHPDAQVLIGVKYNDGLNGMPTDESRAALFFSNGRFPRPSDWMLQFGDDVFVRKGWHVKEPHRGIALFPIGCRER